MKIAAVSIYPGRSEKHVKASGVASYTKNLLKNIPLNKDDELYVVCNKLDGKHEEYKEDGFTIVRVFDRNTKFVRQIYKAIRAIDADVVHIQQEVPLYGGVHTAYLLQWLVWLLRKKKVVVTLHHVVSLKKIDKNFVRSNNSSAPVWMIKLAFQVIYKPLVKRARSIIVHEPYFKDILVNEYGADARKITAVPHGVENFQPIDTMPARQAIGVEEDRHVVLFMGYLAGYKGFDLLLEGFAEYAKKNPKAMLVIGAGKHPKLDKDPTYLAEYVAKQQKAQELIPQSQYKWIGFIKETEIAAYYSASDVSLYPYIISMSSSGPMSFAMGYERAFLASDAFKAVLPHELLFERKPKALANKLDDFFAQPKAYTKIAKTLKTERLWSKVGQRTRSVYEEA